MYSGAHGRAIVFCETKKEADLLATSDAMTADAHVLHGDIPQDKREMVLKVCSQPPLTCADKLIIELHLLRLMFFWPEQRLGHFSGPFLGGVSWSPTFFSLWFFRENFRNNWHHKWFLSASQQSRSSGGKSKERLVMN